MIVVYVNRYNHRVAVESQEISDQGTTKEDTALLGVVTLDGRALMFNASKEFADSVFADILCNESVLDFTEGAQFCNQIFVGGHSSVV